ncbi:hypothetical protein PoB_001772100 [Plakobranchus ocellatus]|uniref:DUF4817 domain-containing protein n=1 Tax=Plakobranchus ocellatus TaxID=259542 RepID=A0AAV3Z5S3_9GAST|nr:hypothetical protein PoB_001772100 [Plakobranchus ocellatus]
MREQIAGPSKTSSDVQRVSELKLLPITDRREISGKASVKEKTGMSIESAIAIKETVGLTWSQLRTQRKFLKEFGLNLPNEARQRRRGKQLIAKYINVESKEFNVEGEIKSKPHATIRNTQNYLLNLLDTYQQNNRHNPRR